MKTHSYTIRLHWTGNTGLGTHSYTQYERSFTLSAPHKPIIHGSSDPAFRGDASQYNPEDLLVSALSSCHMLWYLHLCAKEGIVVQAYTDQAEGKMNEQPDGKGQFTEVILHPVVTITDPNQKEKALALHALASQYCFIANSVNFPVKHIPEIHMLP